MKAFVEFGRETSDTKSTSHAEFKTWLKRYLTLLVVILLAYVIIRL